MDRLKPPFKTTGQALSAEFDLIARLAALVPKHRVNLTRFHGVFAPNSKYRTLTQQSPDR